MPESSKSPVRTMSRYGLCLLYILSCAASGGPQPPLSAPRLAFDQTEIMIQTEDGTTPLQVELATDPQQRSRGLMDRARLPTNAGMLFVYPEAQSPLSGFWMFRTRIPLDIAFLNAQGKILAIQSMTPCASADQVRCPSYLAGVPYTAALEVNRGFFERHGITVGDRIQLPGR